MRLELDGLTVLIGENGTGKSSLLEGLQLLNALGSGRFDARLNEDHGGILPLLGLDGGTLELGHPVVATFVADLAQAWSRLFGVTEPTSRR